MLGHVELITVQKIGIPLPNGQINFIACIRATNREDGLVIIKRLREDLLRPFAIDYVVETGALYEINGHVINFPEISFETYYKIRISDYLKDIIL